MARNTKALKCCRQPDNMSEPPPPKRARSGATHAALKEEIEKSIPVEGEIEYYTKSHKKSRGR